jgi:hypothetical protein
MVDFFTEFDLILFCGQDPVPHTYKVSILHYKIFRQNYSYLHSTIPVTPFVIEMLGIAGVQSNYIFKIESYCGRCFAPPEQTL